MSSENRNDLSIDHAPEILACLDRFDDQEIWGSVFSFHPFDIFSTGDDLQSGTDFPDPTSSRFDPKKGIHSPEVNIERFAILRKSSEFLQYCPTVFARPKLRSICDFHKSETVSCHTDFFNLLSAAKSESVASITFVCLDEVCFSPKQKAELPLILHLLKHLEVLIIRSSNLSNVQEFSCGSVIYIDLSFNNLCDLRGLLRMLSSCNSLFYSDFTGNIILDEENSEDLIITACPSLQYLNKKVVDLKRKVTAIKKFGATDARTQIGFEIWDSRLCQVVARLGMKKFDASLLRELCLENNGLVMIHLGLFVHLERLDLSSNYIRELQGTGLEQLESLRSLELTKNLLHEPDELEPLNALPAITWLSVCPQRDPDVLTSYEGYRNLLIMLTIDSCGTESRPGLNFLDRDAEQQWILVSIEERLSALTGLNRIAPGDRFELVRWRLCLIHNFGHSKVIQVDFLKAILTLRLTGCSLRFAEVQDMPNLRLLDLSNNYLSAVRGLQSLKLLESLDLRENDPLAIESNPARLMKQIKYMTCLKILYLPFEISHQSNLSSLTTSGNAAVSDASNAIENTEEGIFFHLIAHNPLLYVNERRITIQDRVAVFSMGGKSATEIEHYLANLVLSSSVSRCQKSAHGWVLPEDLEPMIHYDPTAVIELPDIHGFGLTSRALQSVLPRFSNLVRLNLSRNRLDTLLGLGLDSMQHLAVFDVTYNLLADPLPVVGELLDEFASIQFVAFRGNPIFKTPADRLRLIGLMRKMRDCEQTSACRLRFIDSEITFDERVQAWIEAGIPKQEVELMRYRAVIGLCRSAELHTEEVLEIDLNFQNIQVLVADEFIKFRCLQRLQIQSNCLRDISCISALTRLEILDFRNNRIPDIMHVVDVVKCLSRLVELGIDDNMYVGPSYADEILYCAFRKVFLAVLLPYGLNSVGWPLRYLDDRPIHIVEIIDAWHVSDAEKQRFAFYEGVHRALQAQRDGCEAKTSYQAADVQMIDLSSLCLKFLDFTRMLALTSVDVSRNALVDFAIAQSGFALLTNLRALDVSQNKIQSAECIANIVRMGQNRSLRSITVDGNPFFISQDNLEARIRFLSCLESVMATGCTLEFVNGKLLTIDERCEAASYRIDTRIDVNDLRMSLHLEEKCCSVFTGTLCLSFQGLHKLTHLSKYMYLEALDISHNKIYDLTPLRSLPRLSALDMRENQVREFNDALCVLRCCDSLRDVWVECVSLDWGKWIRDHPFFWRTVMKALPALLSCDENLNPAPLAGFQWTAACHLKRRFGIGPNGIVSIDLRGRKIRKEEFYAVRDWVAFLPITELKIDENPFCRDIPIYRFMLINDIKTLRNLNGSFITEPERAAAFKKIDQMKRDFAYYYPNLDSLKVDNYSKGANCASRVQSSYSSSASTASSLGSQMESFLGYVQVQVLVISIPGIRWDSIPFYNDIRDALQPLVMDWDRLLPDLQVKLALICAKSANL